MNPLDELTKQEYVILTLVAKGWRNAQVARELFISVRTVESHLHRIFSKLDVTSRTEAAIFMFQLNSSGNSDLRGITDDDNSYNRYA